MLALLVVSIIWAFSFGLIKGQLTGIDPTLVSAIRLTICFLIFLPFGLKIKWTKSNGILAVNGAIQFGVMYWAYIQSYQYLPGYLVAVFTIFTPIYVFIIHSTLQRSFSFSILLPIVLSVLGAAIIVFKTPENTDWITGFFVLQIANIAFAFGQVSYKSISKKLTQSHSTNMAVMYLGAALFSLAIAIENQSLSQIDMISQHQWLTLIYLGVIASGLGFFLWNLGAKQVKAGHLAIMNNGYIPLAVIFSITIFNEEANLVKLLIGSVCIVLGLWWAAIITSKK